MQISIAEFKARNAEAQRINAEIQKAQGAIEENKRQFAKLCADYEKQFGEKVDETNLESILARVTAEVQAQAEAQALAIEQAKAGIVITATENQGTTAPAAAAPSAPISGVMHEAPAPTPVAAPAAPVSPVPVAPVAPAPASAVAQTVPTPMVTPKPEPTAILGGVQAGQANPFAAPIAPAAPVAPTPAAPAAATPEAEPDEIKAKPLSAASLSAAALKQSNNAETLDMTQQINATQQQAAPTPQFPTVDIPGWKIPTQINVDFNAMLGGAFGGGNK